MTLRGQRVLARCDPSGQLLANGGRVEIRYQPRGGKAYRAAVRNLAHVPGDATLLPDDHCDDTEPSAAPGKKAKPRSKAAARAASSPPPSVATGDEVVVYADGACAGNPGPAGLGVVWLEADRRAELSEYLGQGTNNIAELTAILRALERIEDPHRPLRIFTDSSYAIGVLTRGWKAKKNVALVESIRTALGRLSDVQIVHVPGHAGVPLNERADQLAVAAVEARSSSGWVNVDTER